MPRLADLVLPMTIAICTAFSLPTQGQEPWNYAGPIRVGLVNALHDYNGEALDCETNEHAVDEMVKLGMRAVKLMPMVLRCSPSLYHP